TSCPTGWIEDRDGMQLVACAPPARHDRACSPGMALWIDAEDCARVGGECPAIGYAPDLPASGTIVYAADDAALSTMLPSVLPGTIVALAAGAYSAVSVPDGVELWGACAAETTIASGVIPKSGGLHNLTMSGALAIGPTTGDVSLRSVIVRGAITV